MAKESNLYIRIDLKDRRSIERAAKLDRRSISDFIRLAAIDRATEMIAKEKRRKER